MKAPDATAIDLPESTRPGIGSWFLLAVLVLLLLATVWVFFVAWTSVGNGVCRLQVMSRWLSAWVFR